MHLKKLLISIGVSFLLLSCNSKERLTEKIKAELRRNEGTFAVAFKNLSNGEEILIHEHESFHAASTMKTAVMLEIFHQASKGRFSTSDSITIRNEFYSLADSSLFSLDPANDSESELYGLAGQKQTIATLNYLMITFSSNLATNNLMDLVGAKNVTQFTHEMGANEIEVLRGVEDQKAFDLGIINTTSAFALMVIYENIASRKAVNEDASDEMMEVLLDQKFNETIPAMLPAKARVAHKTGWVTGGRHDAGIVLLEDGRRYVLVLLSKDIKDEAAAIRSMALVSKMIYDYVE